MNSPETVTLPEFRMYPLLLYPKRIEVCRPKPGIKIPKDLGGKRLNDFFEVFFCFVDKSSLPEKIDNPDGVAFGSLKNHELFATPLPEIVPKSPTANDLRNIAKIVNQLLKDADERFVIFWRSFDLFLEWEQEARAIRLIQDTLSKSHELRKLAPTILEMLETAERGLKKMKKNKIRTEWDYAQHIKMCDRNIKNITAILETMSNLL